MRLAVRVLLARGADPNVRRGGETALHWTTYGPHAGTATQLIDAGAAVDARDERFDATPLDWTLYHWVHGYDTAARERGYTLIARLIAAGATPDLERFDEATRAVLAADARLMALLDHRGTDGRQGS